jgi:hypothetical protein
MRIRNTVAWVGDTNRVVILRLDAEFGPMVLTGEAAALWMAAAQADQVLFMARMRANPKVAADLEWYGLLV